MPNHSLLCASIRQQCLVNFDHAVSKFHFLKKSASNQGELV
jgi:hypothetical protein